MSVLSLAHRMVRDQRGAYAVIFALTTPMLLAGIGLTIDMSRAYVVKAQLQNAADAAALAAARRLTRPVNDGNNGHGNDPGRCDPSNPATGGTCSGAGVVPPAALDDALAIAPLNAPGVTAPVVAQDVKRGTYDGAADMFTPGDGGQHVRVVARRSMPLLFGPFLGFDRMDIVADAVAQNAGGTRSCPDGQIEPQAPPPTRMSITTLGEGNPATYRASTEGWPWVRVDNPFNEPVKVTIRVAAGADNRFPNSYTMDLPGRGRYHMPLKNWKNDAGNANAPGASVVLSIDRINNVPRAAFNTQRRGQCPAPGNPNQDCVSGGTATWANRLRTTDDIPNAVCIIPTEGYGTRSKLVA